VYIHGTAEQGGKRGGRRGIGVGRSHPQRGGILKTEAQAHDGEGKAARKAMACNRVWVEGKGGLSRAEGWRAEEGILALLCRIGEKKRGGMSNGRWAAS